MRLYFYQGLENEKVPEDVTHVIINDVVTIIKKLGFCMYKYLLSIITDYNVNRIEEQAFFC